jgi:hypothetical protein
MKRVSLALALAIAPIVLLAQKTSYDFDKSANFAAYKTFALRDGTPVGQKLIDDRFVAAIEEQLTKKGLKKSETPDLLVAYHMAFDKEKNIQSWSTGVGGHPYGWGYGGGWGTTTTDVRVYDITVGTLVIDVADAARKEVVWRGVGTKEVDTQAKASKLDKNVAKAIEKVLKNYPPKVKK